MSTVHRHSASDKLLDEIVAAIPPTTIPVNISLPNVERLDRAGAEVELLHPNGNTYFVIAHVIADFDWAGQTAFFQIALRGENPDLKYVFGAYRYCFAYRGNDVTWDQWQIDINFGTRRPTYAEFGSYCDDAVKRVDVSSTSR